MDVYDLPDLKNNIEEVARRVIQDQTRVAVRLESGGIVVLMAPDSATLDALEDEEDARAIQRVLADPDEEFRPADQVLAELGL
jgi:hypothetical protein